MAMAMAGGTERSAEEKRNSERKYEEKLGLG